MGLVALLSPVCFICLLVIILSRPLECAFTPNNQHINI